MPAIGSHGNMLTDSDRAEQHGICRKIGKRISQGDHSYVSAREGDAAEIRIRVCDDLR